MLHLTLRVGDESSVNMVWLHSFSFISVSAQVFLVVGFKRWVENGKASAALQHVRRSSAGLFDKKKKQAEKLFPASFNRDSLSGLFSFISCEILFLGMCADISTTAATFRILWLYFTLQYIYRVQQTLISNTNVPRSFGLSMRCCVSIFCLLFLLNHSINCWRGKVNKPSENAQRVNTLNVTRSCLTLFPTHLSLWVFYDGSVTLNRAED